MFPDAEGAVVAYLNGRLTTAGDAARASTRVPSTRPDRFVRAILTGSTRTSVSHRNAQVTVECWDTSETGAERLADQVHAWLCEMDTAGGHVPQGPDGWLGGPYSEPDPDSGSPRYVMTVIVRQREV